MKIIKKIIKAIKDAQYENYLQEPGASKKLRVVKGAKNPFVGHVRYSK